MSCDDQDINPSPNVVGCDWLTDGFCKPTDQVVTARNGDELVLFDEDSPAEQWIESDYWFDLEVRE